MNQRILLDTLLECLPDVEAVYLFGSRARGDATPASDFDLAILPAGPLAPLHRFELRERLESALHATVDLIDLRTASSVLRVQVLKDGILLYERDIGRRQSFEAYALSAYARLNEERRKILEDVKARGHVYG